MPSTSQLKTSIFANLTNIRSDSSFGNNLYYFIMYVLSLQLTVESNRTKKLDVYSYFGIIFFDRPAAGRPAAEKA